MKCWKSWIWDQHLSTNMTGILLIRHRYPWQNIKWHFWNFENLRILASLFCEPPWGHQHKIIISLGPKQSFFHRVFIKEEFQMVESWKYRTFQLLVYSSRWVCHLFRLRCVPSRWFLDVRFARFIFFKQLWFRTKGFCHFGCPKPIIWCAWCLRFGTLRGNGTIKGHLGAQESWDSFSAAVDQTWCFSRSSPCHLSWRLWDLNLNVCDPKKHHLVCDRGCKHVFS